MKKLSFLALAAAGMLLGACSEKDEVVSDVSQTNQYGLVAGESSWIAVGISMPGDAITRANEHLIDGDATEYNVYSGTLYLFKGANEDDAVLFGIYPITPTFNKETSDNVPAGNDLVAEPTADGYGEITSTSTRVVQEIENPRLGADDKLYAYVILNDKDNATNMSATVNTTTGSLFKLQQLQAIGIADETKGFGSIYTKQTGSGDAAVTTGGLVMTNVPIATVAGGDQNPTEAQILTFTEVDKSAIYRTYEEANTTGKPMACIYVERAAVKVEVKLAANFGIQLEGENSVTTIDATDVKWALGNVNYGGTVKDGDNLVSKGYYNTRQFEADWKSYNNLLANPQYLQYRMIGRTPFFAATATHSTNPGYRTYFGKDPNYVGTQPTTQWVDGAEVSGYNGKDGYIANTGLLNAQLTEAQYTLSPNSVTYTYENTFDENSQIYRNTTYVGVKVKINNGDFYTIEGQPNMKLANVTAIQNVVVTRLRDVINAKISAVKTAINNDLGSGSRTISAGVTNVTFDIVATVALTANGYNETTGEQAYTVTLSLDNINTDKDYDADGNGEISTEEAGLQAQDIAAINALATSILGVIDNPDNSKVYKYVGGVAYYSARIQHFGDVETPWGAPAEAYNIYMNNDPCVYPANAQQTYGTPAALHTFGTDRANAWLGRWGIVRNNWYEITLKKIENIGSPVPEDFNGEAGMTPDDNPEPKYYIAAEIHILPWVKRTQSVNF